MGLQCNSVKMRTTSDGLLERNVEHFNLALPYAMKNIKLMLRKLVSGDVESNQTFLVTPRFKGHGKIKQWCS